MNLHENVPPWNIILFFVLRLALFGSLLAIFFRKMLDSFYNELKKQRCFFFFFLSVEHASVNSDAETRRIQLMSYTNLWPQLPTFSNTHTDRPGIYDLKTQTILIMVEAMSRDRMSNFPISDRFVSEEMTVILLPNSPWRQASALL